MSPDRRCEPFILSPPDVSAGANQVGDKINYVKVLDGLQNLQTSQA